MGRVETIGTTIVLFSDGTTNELEKFDAISKYVKDHDPFMRTAVFCKTGMPKGFWKFENIDYFEASNMEAKLEEFRIRANPDAQPECCVEIIENHSDFQVEGLSFEV